MSKPLWELIEEAIKDKHKEYALKYCESKAKAFMSTDKMIMDLWHNGGTTITVDGVQLHLVLNRDPFEIKTTTEKI